MSEKKTGHMAEIMGITSEKPTAEEIISTIDKATYWMIQAQKMVKGLTITRRAQYFIFTQEEMGIEFTVHWRNIEGVSMLICRTYARGQDSVKDQVRSALDNI